MSKHDIRSRPHLLAGLGLAIVTPLTERGEPDLPALGSGGQVHRAGCQPIPREVDQRTVFGHCV